MQAIIAEEVRKQLVVAVSKELQSKFVYVWYHWLANAASVGVGFLLGYKKGLNDAVPKL